MTTYTFEIESDVAALPEEVWRQATDMGSVNLELRPLLRMTFPAQIRNLNIAGAPHRLPPFRSCVLLFGVLPIDSYNVYMVAFEPHRRFLERSMTVHYRLWQHERIIEPLPAGTRIKDRLVTSPRVGCLGPLLHGFVRFLFRLRHKNLLNRYSE